ncbi:MAG: hypothetical protein Q9M30_07200 [Mariprofundaceae bacterium]|nr:hypothetical protein [Mariprofundaceae bacterium]
MTEENSKPKRNPNEITEGPPCPYCGVVGQSYTEWRGNFWLWLLLMTLAPVFPPMLVIAIIYAIWAVMSRKTACLSCGTRSRPGIRCS